MRSFSFVRRDAAIKASEEFFAPLTFKTPLSGCPPITSRCGGLIFLLIVATLLILVRTAYPAIMPSGYQIVQSTLLKIDGFKLNIDNVESLNKIFNIVFNVFNKKIQFLIQCKKLFCFLKINNLRLENY